MQPPAAGAPSPLFLPIPAAVLPGQGSSQPGQVAPCTLSRPDLSVGPHVPPPRLQEHVRHVPPAPGPGAPAPVGAPLAWRARLPPAPLLFTPAISGGFQPLCPATSSHPAGPGPKGNADHGHVLLNLNMIVVP